MASPLAVPGSLVSDPTFEVPVDLGCGHQLVERLRAGGITVVFSGLKKQVLDVMRRTHLDALIGADNLFPNDDQALAAIYASLGREGRGELLPA